MKPVVESVGLQHYVEFYVDGLRPADQVEPQLVRNRSVRRVKIPDDAFAFSFYDLVVVKVRLGRRSIELTERVNDSYAYHVGEALTSRAITARFPKDNEILHTLKRRGLRRALRSRNHRWYPLNDDDVVINPNGGTT